MAWFSPHPGHPKSLDGTVLCGRAMPGNGWECLVGAGDMRSRTLRTWTPEPWGHGHPETWGHG